MVRPVYLLSFNNRGGRGAFGYRVPDGTYGSGWHATFFVNHVLAGNQHEGLNLAMLIASCLNDDDWQP